MVDLLTARLLNLPWRGRSPEVMAEGLLEFAAPARVDGGFGWLDDVGAVVASRGVQLWISGRMTHAFSQGTARFGERWREHAEHGVAALLDGPLRDPVYAGWSLTAGRPSQGDLEGQRESTRKAAYAHTFVILAGASATGAGVARGEELLAHALAVWDSHFWDSVRDSVRDSGRDSETASISESFASDWSDRESYRGANAHMHGVEMLLATFRATGDRARLSAALAITERLVHGVAGAHEWRMPEHFGLDWQPLWGYNTADPAHPFRPFGVTIGHLFEWSRLCVELAEALALAQAAPTWLVEDARRLFDRAMIDGWGRDGADGFVYTTDFAGAPVVTSRLHWVVAEAISAAAALARVSGDPAYDAAWLRLTHHAVDHFVEADGSWRHELSATLAPSASMWLGKPDIYHAWGALLTHPSQRSD